MSCVLSFLSIYFDFPYVISCVSQFDEKIPTSFENNLRISDFLCHFKEINSKVVSKEIVVKIICPALFFKAA